MGKLSNKKGQMKNRTWLYILETWNEIIKMVWTTLLGSLDEMCKLLKIQKCQIQMKRKYHRKKCNLVTQEENLRNSVRLRTRIILVIKNPHSKLLALMASLLSFTSSLRNNTSSIWSLLIHRKRKFILPVFKKIQQIKYQLT